MSPLVYVVTSQGIAELNGASTALTRAELEVLVLVDGIASVADIAARARNELTAAAVAETLEKLARRGFVADAHASDTIDAGDFFKASDLGVASLEAKGFFVHFARRAPAHAKLAPGQKLTVLVVESNAQLANLLRTYLHMEKFLVRIAANAAEITNAMREPPRPDVVLLDARLPDVDGFDVLAKIRSHPLVKDLPVIMATEQATRAAVLKGLQLGANGYLTKPYDMPVVLRAVRAALGLPKSHDSPWSGPV